MAELINPAYFCQSSYASAFTYFKVNIARICVPLTRSLGAVIKGC